MILKTPKMSSITLANNELAKLIKKNKVRNYWRSRRTWQCRRCERGKFCYKIKSQWILSSIWKSFWRETHWRRKITDYLDAQDGTFNNILEKIANKISEKTAIATSKNKSIKLLQLLNFFFKSFVTPRHAENKSSCTRNAKQ